MFTLETERLLLRDFTLEDWEAINAIVSDPEVTRYMHFSNWDETRRREWLDWMVAYASNPQRDAYNWALTLKSNATLIGWLGIGGSSHEEGARSFGYALGSRSWNHGYMTKALQTVLDYEFNVLATSRIVAECETRNIASARVMQKCGMTFVGTFFDQDFEGNWAERHHYTISS
ncbi:acetyltransferase [Ktedonobacter sp. SOSP1-52]|uniref:GNAT family N-acetyltransferase n=1 Tax=Ktedonobacter sp. SOSP1-52 TaxID=2778366 RepID=UPI0019155F68|nr:GNAT family N-acetyltransferase [Ktedonobacter sp. SOSP1-52]GHO62443.1 acetyltransferase [Ktedonobacter sp. SOSP1-52]